jgi:cell division protein FtsL
MTHLLPPPALRALLVRAGMACLLAVAVTLLYLAQHFHMVELGYRVEQGRADLAALKHRRAELMVEVATLSSLDRIERLARERLSMTAPAPAQLVRVLPPGADSEDDTPPAMMLAARARR